jgi:hypothetical protein
MHQAYMSLVECGSAAFVCLLIGVVGSGLGLLGLLLLATRARGAAPVLGGIAAVLGVTALGVGLLGREMARHKMEDAFASGTVDPSQAAQIRARGTVGADMCISVGATTGALPFVVGALALGVGLSLRKRPKG